MQKNNLEMCYNPQTQLKNVHYSFILFTYMLLIMSIWLFCEPPETRAFFWCADSNLTLFGISKSMFSVLLVSISF